MYNKVLAVVKELNCIVIHELFVTTELPNELTSILALRPATENAHKHSIVLLCKL